MKNVFFAFVLVIMCCAVKAQIENSKSLPVDRGLPQIVNIGLNLIELNELNENSGYFSAKVDQRLRWQDKKLIFKSANSTSKYKEYLDDDAEKKLTEIWQPNVIFANAKGTPSVERISLRIHPNGNVEQIQRVTANFSIDLSMEKFPFDRQKLVIKMISRTEPVERLRLVSDQDDLEFSHDMPAQNINGWLFQTKELVESPQLALRGAMNSGVSFIQTIKRQQPNLLATIFVPLFATLLIPLLAIWLNKKENGEFALEATDLTNLSVGGLFAVIALNFTVNSNLIQLANGDNPVMRLFGLNYVSLAISFFICVSLFRFNIINKLFGPYLAEEIYHCICWAFPAVILSIGLAILAIALF
jgi:Neurotransmitter-gated ion-channel ligand binding domain